MTDDDDDTPGIELGADGNPIRQGTLMVERQSYERVIDGLRIAAEACMHLARWEDTSEAVDNRKLLAHKIDIVRFIAIKRAGIEDASRAAPTREVSGAPLPFKEAWARLVDGLMQAAGGARQLATCFRMDLGWSRAAGELEALHRKVRSSGRLTRNSLLLPTGYLRQ